MGIRRFYSWYKNKFEDCLLPHPATQIDVLAVDMNGLFHASLQTLRPYENASINLFRTVCGRLESIRKAIDPQKMLIISVDGVAGLAKMNQQRQRRFRSQSVPSQHIYNSNIFTPGTQLMDLMTKHLDWYIRMMMTSSPDWKKLVVIFSNEKVPGEGEHKIFQYVRAWIPLTDKVCIYGMDADLCMRSILLSHHHVFIARQYFDHGIEYLMMHAFRDRLLQHLSWKDGSSAAFVPRLALLDFQFLCCLLGNDFLPALPSLNVDFATIENILDVYRVIGSKHGHLLHENRHQIQWNQSAMVLFFQSLHAKEMDMLVAQYSSSASFFPDPLVLQNLCRAGDDRPARINMIQLHMDYYRVKQRHSPHATAKLFLDGMFWVVNYYASGMPDWEWYYPFHYAPFVSDILDVLRHDDDPYQMPVFQLHAPLPALLQLVLLLPPSDRNLLPICMRKTIHRRLWFHFPASIQMDVTGKKSENEALVLLPPNLNLNLVLDVYKNYEDSFTPSERKRNVVGKIFRYACNPRTKPYSYLSYFGNITNCCVDVAFLQIS